ncbi:MAG: protein-glutamate O-methyltransferase CheR [Magnetococcales bacterium]|nr:protein-glutamate O-methyltransferase CheR [Magnetococcales bacterium]
MDREATTIEIDLLLEAIFRKYGYDFRDYARASLKRRLRHRMSQEKIQSYSEMQHNLLYNTAFFDRLLESLSVSVTEMFRDPNVYRILRESVIPILNKRPLLKVWHAGCCTGEEVYSMAILLHEADLLNRTQIYATDFNQKSLNSAKKSCFHKSKIRNFSENYQHSGGTNSLLDYVTMQGDYAYIADSLKTQILFTDHNLATDWAFGEMDLIFCRNVLIYFNKTLQSRVVKLFQESLAPAGFICLGHKETLEFLDSEDKFKEIESNSRIYKVKQYQVNQ